jgi:hypothetical protein
MRRVKGDEMKMKERSADIHVRSIGRTRVLHRDFLRCMGLIIFARNENPDKNQKGTLFSKTQ